jgi:hypothetical protein
MMTLSLRDLGFVGGLSGGDSDPYFANVSLLLHGDGTNGSTSIIDSSPNPKIVTAVGNAQISTAQSKFGNSSISLGGSRDRLTVPSNAGFILTSAFAVEAWLYPTNTSSSGSVIMQLEGGGFEIFITPALNIVVNRDPFSTLISTTSAPIVLNSWQHIAITWDGTVARIFRNGSLVGSSSTTTGLTAGSGQLRIGDYSTNNYSYIGYISNLRITKNIARYIANFTVPAAPFPDS